MDSNGFSDPFVVCIHNDDKKRSKTTEIIYKTLNPKWEGKDFTFKVQSTISDTIKLVCWDYDKIGLNDFEGQVVLPIALVANTPNEVKDTWVPLVNKKGKADKDRGEVHVQLTLVDPSAPTPTEKTASGNNVLAPAPVVQNSPASPRPAGLDWQIPFGEIQLLKELGRGQFGIVYKGKWRLQDCAVKVLPKERLGEKVRRVHFFILLFFYSFLFVGAG
jgi:hypothetical protein